MSVRTCPRGHRIAGRNAVRYSYRGKRHTRCRRCAKRYARTYWRRNARRLNRRRRQRRQR